MAAGPCEPQGRAQLDTTHGVMSSSDRPGGKHLADGVKRGRNLNERSQLDLRETEGQES